MRASGYSPKTIEPYTHVINQGPGIKSPLDGQRQRFVSRTKFLSNKLDKNEYCVTKVIIYNKLEDSFK